MTVKQACRWTKRFFQFCLVRLLQRVGRVLFYQSEEAGGAVWRILIVRLDEIGDMVLMSPFLREMRGRFPLAHITLVVKPAVKNLVERCPYIDEILVFEGASGGGAFYRNLWRAFCFAYRMLGKVSYDLAIVPRFDADSGYGAGVIAFFSGAKRRVGYGEDVLATKAISDRGYDGFYTEVLRVRRGEVRHEVERNLDILRFLDGTAARDVAEVWCDEADRMRAEVMLHSLERARIKVVIAVATGSAKRDWPSDAFLALMREIRSQYDDEVNWILVGGGVRAAEAAAQIDGTYEGCVLNLVNRITLRETAAVIDACDIYVGGDTGLMHIASALRKPGVVISCHPRGADEDHCNSPTRFGPWKSQMPVLRPKPLVGCERGCDRAEAHCIREISVDEVAQTLRSVLGGTEMQCGGKRGHDE